MGRLAIFMDGGYLDALARDEYQVSLDYGRLSNSILAVVNDSTPDPVDLARTLYYHCPPYQSNPPTEEEARRYGQSRKFFQALKRLPRFDVRLGRLAPRGRDASGKLIFQQKRTDLMIGLDFAMLAGKEVITHAALVSGDSDLLPAVDVAKREGVTVWLVHGPRQSRTTGKPTFAYELWEAVDERIDMASILEQSTRPTRSPS